MLKEKIFYYGLPVTVIACNILLTYCFNHYLFTRDIYYNSFQNQLENTRIDEMFDLQSKFFWLSFLLIPAWILIKNFVVSLCLQTGLLLNNTKLRFGITFKIAIIAELVFLLAQLLKLGWFLFIKTGYTIANVQQFYPLSALNLIKVENVPPLLIYPFQTINVFEVLYWIILADGIKEALNTEMNKGIKVVFSGYIPALVLWVIFIMFITVNLSPTA